MSGQPVAVRASLIRGDGITANLAGYMSNFGPKWGSGKKPVRMIPQIVEMASGDC